MAVRSRKRYRSEPTELTLLLRLSRSPGLWLQTFINSLPHSSPVQISIWLSSLVWTSVSSLSPLGSLSSSSPLELILFSRCSPSVAVSASTLPYSIPSFLILRSILKSSLGSFSRSPTPVRVEEPGSLFFVFRRVLPSTFDRNNFHLTLRTADFFSHIYLRGLLRCGVSLTKKNSAGHYLNFDLAQPSIPASFYPSNATLYGCKIPLISTITTKTTNRILPLHLSTRARLFLTDLPLPPFLPSSLPSFPPPSLPPFSFLVLQTPTLECGMPAIPS